MKKLSTLFLILFSLITWPQTSLNNSSKIDVEKLMLWVQFIAADNNVSIQYDSVKYQNNVFELTNLQVADFIFPGMLPEETSSLAALVEEGTRINGMEKIYIDKISLNFNYIFAAIEWLETNDQKALRNLNKSGTFFEIEGFELPSELIEEIFYELPNAPNSITKKMSSYLNEFNMKFEQKSKGKARAVSSVEMALNNDISLFYSVDSGINENDLSPPYFELMQQIIEPFNEIAEDLVFLSKMAAACDQLYVKDNLQAWFAVADNTYCNEPLDFFYSTRYEQEIADSLDDLDLLENAFLNQDFLANDFGRFYGLKINVDWSDRFYRDAKLISGGAIDAALLTLKGLFDARFSKQEFETILEEIVGEEFGPFVTEFFQGDELYRSYSKYQPKIKSFANRPKALGVSIEVKEGLDASYFELAAENPLLLLSLLNSVDIELLLNKKN